MRPARERKSHEIAPSLYPLITHMKHYPSPLPNSCYLMLAIDTPYALNGKERRKPQEALRHIKTVPCAHASTCQSLDGIKHRNKCIYVHHYTGQQHAEDDHIKLYTTPPTPSLRYSALSNAHKELKVKSIILRLWRHHSQRDNAQGESALHFVSASAKRLLSQTERLGHVHPNLQPLAGL